MGVHKCNLCSEVFTEKNSFSRHEKNTDGEKTVTHVSCATKSTGELNIYVDIRQVHTLNQLKRNAGNIRKPFQEHTI